MNKVSIQTMGLLNDNCLEKSYENIATAGFTALDYNIIRCKKDDVINLEQIKNQYNIATKFGVEFHQVHEPLWGWDVDLRQDEKLMFDFLKMSLEVCNILKSRYLVVHPYDFDLNLDKKEIEIRNFDFFKKVGLEARKHNVIICIENKVNYKNGYAAHGVCSTSQKLVYLIDKLNEALNEQRFGACFDSGHANILKMDMFEEITCLGDRLKVVHLHDNSSILDSHQLPFTFNQGNVNFSRLLEGLQKIRFDGVISFETYNAIIRSPGVLHQALLSYIKAMGDVFNKILNYEETLEKNKDKNIVFFGAGKMLDVYMSKYGKRYKPYLIVDNNEKLYETKKYGVDIKSPNEILKVDNKLIIIGNLYYEEIELQLLKLGIDEYMLSEEVYRALGKPFTKKWKEDENI